LLFPETLSPAAERQRLKRSLILQKIFDESFRLVNSESQGAVKGLHVFPKGRFPPHDDLQTVTTAELAYPPEKIALQKILYVGDLLFRAFGADYFANDLHPSSSPKRYKDEIVLPAYLILGQADSNVNQIFLERIHPFSFR
jgi:hypothetical protein